MRYIHNSLKNKILRLITNIRVSFLSNIFYFNHKNYIKSKAKNTLEVMRNISDQKISCNSDLPIHLAIGHENLSAAVAFVRYKNDNFVLTHRNIHFNISLSDVSDHKRLINETTLLENSINNGHYGCMTMRNRKSGIKYTSSILGNNISVGLGIASNNKNNHRNNFGYFS